MYCLFSREMRLKPGEKVIDRLENIEDSKGNPGDRGRLVVTNIRILWHSITSPRINLSKYISLFNETKIQTSLFAAIGFNCIMAINTKEVNSVSISKNLQNWETKNFEFSVQTRVYRLSI